MLTAVDGGKDDLTPPLGRLAQRLIISSKPTPRPDAPRRLIWERPPFPLRLLIPTALVFLLACCGGLLDDGIPTVPTLSPPGTTIGPVLYTLPPTTVP
jgi:hypothetical protein